MQEARLTKIASDVREFMRASYPDMIVRAEYWTQDPSRIAVYFIDERFRGLYPRQRYHYVVQLIPKAYYGTFLADTVWFELTPGETPNEVEEDPDEELIVSITPDVLGSLLQSGFFAALDNLLCSINNTTPPEVCYGDFRYAKRTLQDCGFQESDWSDVFHVLMGQGAFCDCEILYNAATESRLRSKYWQRHSHQIRS